MTARIDELVVHLRQAPAFPSIPFALWSAIGQLVVQPTLELVITDADGGILLTERRDAHWDGWHIPGGFSAPGESLQETCSRVAKRELDINITFERVLDVVPWPRHPYVNTMSLFCACSTEQRPADGRMFYAVPDNVICQIHRDFLVKHFAST